MAQLQLQLRPASKPAEPTQPATSEPDVEEEEDNEPVAKPPPKKTESHMAVGTFVPSRNYWRVEDDVGDQTYPAVTEDFARSVFASITKGRLYKNINVWWRGPQPERFWEEGYNPGRPPDAILVEEKK